eukprot:TRINITY_DN4416_c0_g3_i1.p1 TRINITY_DN4416_c0_g3~~TRINITY_DN4416_c0_g3_i1.p1  ORF type:complete len:1732 (-),score=250.08 TRINITY_DN4416_c0_g3_i1:310-5463(-)
MTIATEQAVNLVAPVGSEQAGQGGKKTNEEPTFFVMTRDQKRKLDEWIEFADLGVELHEEAQRIYEKYSFYLQACPTLILSSVAAMLSAGFDKTTFEEAIGSSYVSHSLVLSVLNALNTLLIGCANYWNWQAKAETNKFAAREYDKLRERLRVKRSRMELGDLPFKDVLDEVEKSIVEVKKQCGPPPSGLLRQHQFRRSVADVSQLQALEHMYKREDTCFARCAWRCRRLLCPTSMRKKHLPSANNVQRLLDVKIQQVRNCSGDDSLGHYWLGMWETYEGAIERSDLEIASKLLKTNAAFHDRNWMAEVIKWQCHERTPLHLAIMHGSLELCNFILDELSHDVVKFMCVKKDCTGRIPIECLVREDMYVSFGEQLILHTLQGLCDDAIKAAIRREEGEGQVDGGCGTKGLETLHSKSCEAFLKYVHKCTRRQTKVEHIRDKRGYNMAHIAAEANDVKLLKELLKMESFCVSDAIERARDAPPGAKEDGSLELDSVLSVALWHGHSESVETIFDVYLHCERGGIRTNQSKIDEALQKYTAKMLNVLKQDLCTVGPQRSMLNHRMLELFGKATSKLDLPWSDEWHDELTNFNDQERSHWHSIKDVHFNLGKQETSENMCPAKNVSLMHYAVVRSLPTVVEALMWSGHALQEDSNELTPYDYLVLRLRWMVNTDASDSDRRLCIAKMYPERYIALRECFESMFKHVKDNQAFVDTISKLVPSATATKGWKKGKSEGTALQVACLLQCPEAVENILESRLRTSKSHARLGLTESVLERFKSAGGSAGESVSKHSFEESPQTPCWNDLAPVKQKMLFRSAKSISVQSLSETLARKPVDLAVSFYLSQFSDEGNKEVLRLLLLYAHRANCLPTVLADLCECLPDIKENEPKILLKRNLVNLLFHRNELDDFCQSTMIGPSIFGRYESSTQVAFPCDQFTFGSLKAGQSTGRWYYEVEFSDKLFHGKKNIGVCIGWAAESFSKHSTSQVGGAPLSWSFSPVFLHDEQRFSQLRLAGATRKSEETIECVGVGVLIDLHANKISWRVIHEKDAWSWVTSSSSNAVDVCGKNESNPPPEARFDLGAWRSSDERLVPCMSCNVDEFVANAITVRMSGNFSAKLPDECYPAIVVEEEPMQSIVPFHNEFGNTPSQVPPAYRYDYMTLLHLAALHGCIDRVTSLYHHGAMYLPMLNLPGDGCSYDYEKLSEQKLRKCVIANNDSRPYNLVTSKGARRRVHVEHKEAKLSDLKKIHEDVLKNPTLATKACTLVLQLGMEASETNHSEVQSDVGSVSPSVVNLSARDAVGRVANSALSLLQKVPLSRGRSLKKSMSAGAVLSVPKVVVMAPSEIPVATSVASTAACAAMITPAAPLSPLATPGMAASPSVATPQQRESAQSLGEAFVPQSTAAFSTAMASAAPPASGEVQVKMSPQAPESAAPAPSLPQSMPETTHATTTETEAPFHTSSVSPSGCRQLMCNGTATETPARPWMAATEASLAASASGAAQLAPTSALTPAATTSAARMQTAAPPHVHWLAETALRSESDEDLANVVADSSVPQAAELPGLLHPQKERSLATKVVPSKNTVASPQGSEALAPAISLPQAMPGTTLPTELELERSLAAKAAPSASITVVSPQASEALAPAFSLPQSMPETARATEPQSAEAMMMLATPPAAAGSSAFAFHIQSPSPSSPPSATLAPKTRVFPHFEPWSSEAAPAASADLPMLLE